MQWENNVEPAVLFVCLGNICRSPMAEGAFRSAAEKAGLRARADSAGTAAYHIDDAPDPRAIATAARYGVDISGLRGRQLVEDDFETFTHIFAMDTANMAGIRARMPRYGTAQVGLLLHVLGRQTDQSVSDPYYGHDADFEECWNTISEAVDALVQELAWHGREPLQQRQPMPQ